MSKVPFSVSCYDIDHVLAQVGLTVNTLTQEQLLAILHFVGMDTKGFENEVVLHRPRFSPNNEPWRGARFIGFERQDKEWMACAKCSLENVIAKNEDGDHKRDLVLMSMRANNTLAVCEALENNQPAG